MVAGTVENSDPDYFYYMDYPKPIWTLDLPIEVSPYRIPTFADISGICVIHHCIGKKGDGIIGDLCKATLSHDIRSVASAISKSLSANGSNWAGTGDLIKLAKLCLCQDCGQTQLSDVVIAWVHELETLNELEVERADSVVDDQEKKLSVADLAPVKTLVAASVDTRDLFSKACGYWT